jgi:hypothetical protein
MDNSKRTGFFTSSQMSRLTASLKSGKPSSAFNTYVNEVYLETQMKRPCNLQVKTIPMKWGNLMECVLFNILGLDYKMTHQQSIKHPIYSDNWSGTPDLIKEGFKIGEIKSFQPKNFAELSLCIAKKDIDLFKTEFPKEYWQCVSNAVLCELANAEIISYMPYFDELEEIIEKVEDTNFLESNGLNPQDYYFLIQGDIEGLPYLPKDSKIENITRFEFVVPEEDKEFLTKRVELAIESLTLKLG